MKWPIGLLLALLYLISANVRADAGWTSFGRVTELTSTSQFRLLVTLDIATNPSGCRSKSTFYLDQRSPGSEQMFRMLLEAITSGSMVRLYVTGNCELNGYSEMASVTIASPQ